MSSAAAALADPEPTSAYLADLVDAARREFAERDQRDRLRDALYWQEHPIPHPSHVDFEAVHLGIATEVVQRVKGILDELPAVQVSTTSIADLAVRRSTKVEDFVNHLFPA